MRLSAGIWVKLVIFVTLLLGAVSTEAVAAEGLARTDNVAVDCAVGQEFLNSWRVLDGAGYNSLKLNVTSLENLTKLLTNQKLISAGLSDDIVARLIAANRGPGAAALDKLTKGLDDLAASGTTFKDIGKLLSDMEKGSGFAEGARWIQKYIVNNTNEFTNKIITFEEVIKAGSGIRRVDVKVGSDFFEFKSVSPPLPPANFTSQFIKDLEIPAVTDVKQLKWYFDGSKVSEISKTDFLNAINNGVINQGTIDKLIGQGATKQQLMKRLSDEFDNIFQVKNVD